jgi:bifunctional DNA-binding transcriptional regulator/antitoxin component of YhaV-PrlF toxin-antitoxin module
MAKYKKMTGYYMLTTKVKLSQGGRIVLPTQIRKALAIEIGDELFMKVENQQLKIFSFRHAVKEAQMLMAKYNPKKKQLSEEIIEDRRHET